MCVGSVNDGDTDSCSANGDEGRGSDGGTEGQLTGNSKDTVVGFQNTDHMRLAQK